MRTIPDKTDAVSTLPAVEFNDLKNDVQYAISDTGIALTDSDVHQISKGMAIHGARGDFYTDGGSANSYVLSPIGIMKTPPGYVNGMRVRFRPANANTGASTVNVAGLGVVTISDADGVTVPAAGQIPAGKDVTLVYDGTYFRVVHASANYVAVSTLPHSMGASGRLSLDPGEPVFDVGSTGTIYYLPHTGDTIYLWNGSAWTNLQYTARSIAVPATADTMYDVFAYDNAGTVALELAVWTSLTARAVGLVRLNGILVKSGTPTRRYLGSFCTRAVSGTTGDSPSERLLFNWENRVPRNLYASIPTASWTYGVATLRPSNTNTTIGEGRVAFVIGYPGTSMYVAVNSTATGSLDDSATGFGLGLDSTVGYEGSVVGQMRLHTSTATLVTANGSLVPSIGYHYLQSLEASNTGGNTATFYGNSIYHRIHGIVEG